MSAEAWKMRLHEAIGLELTELQWRNWLAYNHFRGACVNLTALTVFREGRHRTADQLTIGIAVHLRFLGQLIDITWTSAMALGDKVNDRNGQRAIRVSGGGMDLGYHLVHNLSMTLYGVENRGGYTLSHDWA